MSLRRSALNCWRPPRLHTNVYMRSAHLPSLQNSRGNSMQIAPLDGRVNLSLPDEDEHDLLAASPTKLRICPTQETSPILGGVVDLNEPALDLVTHLFDRKCFASCRLLFCLIGLTYVNSPARLVPHLCSFLSTDPGAALLAMCQFTPSVDSFFAHFTLSVGSFCGDVAPSVHLLCADLVSLRQLGPALIALFLFALLWCFSRAPFAKRLSFQAVCSQHQLPCVGKMHSFLSSNLWGISFVWVSFRVCLRSPPPHLGQHARARLRKHLFTDLPPV